MKPVRTMKDRKTLLQNSENLKTSLKSQVDEIKDKSSKYGRSALWIGGGLLAVWALSKVIKDSPDEDEAEVEEVEPQPTKSAQATRTKSESKLKLPEKSVLLESVQEKAIVFLLGEIAERLKGFIDKLEEDEE